MLAIKAEKGTGDGEVGRLVDSSQADDRRMIGLVRERRLLYARNNMPVASYYSQVKKLWQEVAEEMGWTVAEVRRKWSHIRNSYSRHLRNELHGVRTGRGRVVSRWYLADELQFLRDHMATDTRPCRYSYAPVYVESNDEEPSGVERDFMSSPWFALSQASQRKPEPSERQPRPDGLSSFDADENSAYFQFFRGIHNDYRELPATKQRLFRRECLATLHRLLDAAEDAEATSDRSSQHSDDDTDRKLCIVQRVHSADSALTAFTAPHYSH